MNKSIQAKHLDEKAILTFLKELPLIHFNPPVVVQGTANSFGIDLGGNNANSTSIFRALPPNTPRKVLLAKMRAMIERGLVSGCACGCRGDFEITPKGLDYLRTMV